MPSKNQMEKWEYYRALLLETRIKNMGLTPAEFSQLKEILDLQFQDDCYIEVTGSIFRGKDQINPLEFKVIRAPEISEIEKALKAFRERDFSKIALLADYVSKARAGIEEYHGQNLDLETAAVIFEIAARKPASLEGFSDEKIETYFDFYKHFLESYIGVFGRDMKVGEKGFIGIFHCHKDGSKPSPLDIHTNIESGIPDLVISATKDYQQSGATLYLITEGQVKELYNGPLKPKE